MAKKLIKAQVEVKHYCSECGNEIADCAKCQKHFWEGDVVYCNRKTGEHCCTKCQDA